MLCWGRWAWSHCRSERHDRVWSFKDILQYSVFVCLPPFSWSRVSPHLGKSLPSHLSYLRPFQEGFYLSLILIISLLKLNMFTVPNILCDFLLSKFRSHNCEIVLFWLNHLPSAETLLAHDFQTESLQIMRLHEPFINQMSTWLSDYL